jgi:hypothetical protein
MKRYLPILLVLFFILLLAGCAEQSPRMGADATGEGWHQSVETNTHQWTRGADSWFLTGEPNATERENRHANPNTISTKMVPLPGDFSNIKVGGDFQVQIFGSDHNSVYVYGPKEGTQQVAVNLRGNTLCVTQTQTKQPQPIPRGIMNRVIVRIGVRSLHQLTQEGAGSIEAIQIQSNHLSITSTSTSTGNIFLSGHVNLRHVKHAGCGRINVFGAYTPVLDIETSNKGTVNICGNVGIRSITHVGWGDINIIGANTDALTVYTDGAGKIAMSGTVNVRKVTAKGNTCVYIYAVCSDHLEVDVRDSAHVGLSGYVNDLYVNTYGIARFEGRYLCAVNAFVRAHGKSHINTTASSKIFATADRRSTIYFFGPANLLSPVVKGDGTIIAIEGRFWCNVNSEFRPYSYTKTNGQEIGFPRRIKRVRMNYKGE